MLATLVLLAVGPLPPKTPLVRAWSAVFPSRIDQVVVSGHTAYVGTWLEISAIDLQTGRRLWQAKTPEESNVGLVLGKRDLFVLSPPGYQKSKGWMTSYRASDGHVNWRLSHTGESPRLATNGKLLFGELKADQISAIDPSNHQIKWSRRLPPKRKHGDLDYLQYANGLVLASQGNSIVAMDANSGSSKWSVKLPKPKPGELLTAPTMVAHPSSGALVVSSNDSEVSYSLKTGRPFWTHFDASLVSSLFANKRVVVEAGGSLRGLDPRLGTIRWTVKVEAFSYGPLECRLFGGFLTAYAQTPAHARVFIDDRGKIAESIKNPEDDLPIWWDGKLLLLQSEGRLIAFRHGQLKPVPRDVASRRKLADKLCASYAGLSKDELTQLASLKGVALPYLLRTILKIDRTRGEMDMAAYENLRSAATMAQSVATPDQVPLVISALATLKKDSPARGTLSHIVAALGNKSTSLDHFIEILQKADDRSELSNFGMMQSDGGVALEYVKKSHDPKAIAFMIAELKNPKAPSEIRDQAYVSLADKGPEGLAAVLAERKHPKPLPSLENRLDLGHLVKLKNGRGGIIDERKDTSGTTWCLFQDGSLGSDADLWIAKKVGGKWVHPLFTGVSSDRWSGFIEPKPAPMTFHGKTRAQLIAGAWFKEFVGNPELKKDSDGDGLTDLEEARLGTDPTKPSTNGNGIGDATDPWPTVTRMPITEDEKVIDAAWEARYHFQSRSSPAVFSPPKNFQPCRFTGWPGPVVVANSRWSTPLQKLYEQGVAFVSLAGYVRTKTGFADQPISWNHDHTEATVSISTYYGGLDGTVYEMVVRKFGNDWVVVAKRMTAIS